MGSYELVQVDHSAFMLKDRNCIAGLANTLDKWLSDYYRMENYEYDDLIELRSNFGGEKPLEFPRPELPVPFPSKKEVLPSKKDVFEGK